MANYIPISYLLSKLLLVDFGGGGYHKLSKYTSRNTHQNEDEGHDGRV